MSRYSAGILLHTTPETGLPQVLLVHPGGPFWRNKDARAWSMPKGEYEPPECARAAALREFAEETGMDLGRRELVELGTATQPSGKVITAWAAVGELDVNAVRSNEFELEWPPKSGRAQRFPEVDRAAWCTPPVARKRLHAGQVVFVERLLAQLGADDAIR